MDKRLFGGGKGWILRGGDMGFPGAWRSGGWEEGESDLKRGATHSIGRLLRRSAHGSLTAPRNDGREDPFVPVSLVTRKQDPFACVSLVTREKDLLAPVSGQ
jgi:hypothetical protein